MMEFRSVTPRGVERRPRTNDTCVWNILTCLEHVSHFELNKMLENYVPKHPQSLNSIRVNINNEKLRLLDYLT